MIRVVSEDTYVFVLVHREELECQVQTEGEVGYENAGPRCLQWHGMNALCNYDMTSYPYAKAKTNALNILLTGGNGRDAGGSDEDGKNMSWHYGQPPGTPINSGCYTPLFINKKSYKVKTLPPTSTNLFLQGYDIWDSVPAPVIA